MSSSPVSSPVGEQTRAELVARYRSLAATGSIGLAQDWLVSRLADRTVLEWVRVIISLEADDEGIAASAWLADAALKRFADPASFQYVLGVERKAAGHSIYAEGSLRTALLKQPGHAEAAFALAELMRENGRLDAARDVLCELARGLSAEDSDTRMRCAVFLNQCQRAADALAICEPAFASGLALPRMHLLAAELNLTLGRFAPARAHLEKVLAEKDPAIHGSALQALVDTQRYEDSRHPDFAMIRSALDDPAISGPQRAAARFAFGKACDDVGDYAAASQAWREANQYVKEGINWSSVAWSRFIQQQIQEPRPTFAVPSIEDFVPVFIVGLPRSGTTLVSQLLSRYPRVRARGEMNWLPFVWTQLSLAGLRGEPGAVYQASRLYYTHVHQDDAPSRWYLDKNPLNFRYLNLLASMFPAARVIHCRRNSRDTALSIFSHHFAAGNNEFSYDLADIALVAESSERLMDHWKHSLPLAIHTVDYEHLVSDAGDVLRSLEQFLGLPPASVHDESQGNGIDAIATSSRWQARQPIYQRSVGRSRFYEPYLPELNQIPA